MNKNIIFTVCAKNYLAQALTLRESVLSCNQDIDFVIYLSDQPDGLNSNLDITVVDENIVPNNNILAFKYDVVEYSTAVKPFIINNLFKKGYQKVSYIDPDIFVVDNLSFIFDSLEDKSVFFTPHRCTILNKDELTPESAILYNGMFNLGFFAVKNNFIGQELINWWSEKLYNLCYMDVQEALAVDQKWMEFAMCFYPDDIIVSKNLGLNVASWNLQERQLFKDGDRYFIRSLKAKDDIYPLVFWHFSSFNPHINQLLKNDPNTKLDKYPIIKELSSFYIKKLLANGFDEYSKLKYQYNFFSNGIAIMPIHRRLFRINEDKLNDKGNPFDSSGYYYLLLKKNSLIGTISQSQEDPRRKTANNANSRMIEVASLFLKIVLRILGVSRYSRLLKAFSYFSKLENNDFLINI